MKQQPKYRLDLNDFIILYGGTKLYRISALRDFGNVKAGDKGGYIQSEKNLSHEGNCWVGGNAYVFGDAEVFGDARVYGNTQVYGDASVFGDAEVFGDARVSRHASVSADACLRIGEYRTPPLYLQGSFYGLTLNGSTHIAIGCQCLTFEEWLGEKGEELSKMYRFTQTEIAEYKRHIEYMISTVKALTNF